MPTHYLSKSKIVSGSQCPKRVWLEVHRPDLLEFGAETEQRFAMGHEVGEEARRQWPGGILVGHDRNLAQALSETRELMSRAGPVTLFEGTFAAEGVLVRTDILSRTNRGIRLVEVKASTSVKDYQLLDVAVQAWVCQQAGLDLDCIELAHINRDFVYPGGGDYRGLFTYVDVRSQIAPLVEKIPALIAEMRKVLSGPEPEISMGPHCTNPFACPFINYCTPPQPEYPVNMLPRGGKVVEKLLAEGYRDLREVPEGRLTSRIHQRIWRVTRSGKPEVLDGVKQELDSFPFPRYYMDFETVQFAVPIWEQTRPYDMLPFQWSLHVEQRQGKVEHKEFLSTTREAPMDRFCDALVESVGKVGPVFVYNAGFESRILRELAERYPAKRRETDAIIARIVDLFPITRKYYYHPAMHGSWSIKAVAPTIGRDLSYKELGEVQDSGAAPRAFLELIDPESSASRRSEIAGDLKRYCALDTLAMVKLLARLAQ